MVRRISLRDQLYTVIFEHHTAGGRLFDVLLILAILAGVLIVMLDSVAAISRRYGPALKIAEWLITILFTVEYVLRIYSARRRVRYALSFYGIVDLLAILPTFLSLLFPPGRFLVTIRILRVLRVFRVLKLAHFVGEAGMLWRALSASRFKIAVFLATVLAVVVVVGSLIYMIEGADAGFTSIPRSMYWAIVTLTTVGYGDIAPRTPAGQTLAAFLMILGYGIIAVPTGIVTVELGRASRASGSQDRCPDCYRGLHDIDARFCSHCGSRLSRATSGESEVKARPPADEG